MHMAVFAVQELTEEMKERKMLSIEQKEKMIQETLQSVNGNQDVAEIMVSSFSDRTDNSELAHLMDGYCFETDEKFIEFVPYDEAEIETFKEEYQTGTMAAYKFCGEYFLKGVSCFRNSDRDIAKILFNHKPDIIIEKDYSEPAPESVALYNNPKEYIVYFGGRIINIYSLKNHNIEYCDNIPIKEIFTLDQYMYEEYGLINQDGEYGYMENPNGRIDWWIIGGRWNNMLHLYDGNCVNQALLNNIVFAHELSINNLSEEDMNKYEELWNHLSAPVISLKDAPIYFERALLDSEEDIVSVYGTFENFCTQMIRTLTAPACIVYPEADTDAYIWEDSEAWNAKDRRHWCFNRFPEIINELKSRGKEYVVTVVDCHY